MAIRKTRSDCRVGTFEKKHGLPPGTIRNRNGRDTRSDKKNRNHSQRLQQKRERMIDDERNESK